MIHMNVRQGSEAWDMARLGLPTASRFSDIITPKTLKLSSSASKYRNQLLAEWMVGHPIDWTGGSAWMDRGEELEPRARAFYELKHDVEVLDGGFVLRADGKVGGSPDGLIGEDGGIELKCPAMHTHIGYMLEPHRLVDEYRAQVQGYLYLTDRQWWDVMSYSPDLPDVTVRVKRDPEFITALDDALKAFLADLDAAKERLAEHRMAIAA